jgi:hypothetical protein
LQTGSLGLSEGKITAELYDFVHHGTKVCKSATVQERNSSFSRLELHLPVRTSRMVSDTGAEG